MRTIKALPFALTSGLAAIPLAAQDYRTDTGGGRIALAWVDLGGITPLPFTQEREHEDLGIAIEAVEPTPSG